MQVQISRKNMNYNPPHGFHWGIISVLIQIHGLPGNRNFNVLIEWILILQ